MKIEKGHNSFFISDASGEKVAIITYVEANDNTVIIDHTYVSNELRGQGIARQLLNKVVEYARIENKMIIPICSYAKHMMETNDEYKDLIK